MVFYLALALSMINALVAVVKLKLDNRISLIKFLIAASALYFLFLPALVLQPKAIWDDGFNMVLLMFSLGNICCTVWFHPRMESSTRFIPMKRLKLLCLVYFLLVFFSVMEKIIDSGGILNALLRNRMEGYNGGLSKKIYLEFPLLLMQIFWYIYLDKLAESGKRGLALALLIIPILNLIFTAVTRFDLLVNIMGGLFLYFRSSLGKRLDFKKVIVGTFASFIALPYMYLSNLYRSGIYSGYEVSLNQLFTALLDDNKYYSYLYTLHERIGLKDFEWGLNYFYYPIINLIPRSFWSAKPLTSFSVRYTERLYWSVQDGPVVTFTILGETYTQLGYFGAFIAPFFFITTYQLLFNGFSKIRNSELFTFIFAFSSMSFFRSEIPVFKVAIIYMFLLLIIKPLSKKI